MSFGCSDSDFSINAFFDCASCVIVSVYVEKMTPGNCTKVTEALADYLKESGY